MYILRNAEILSLRFFGAHSNYCDSCRPTVPNESLDANVSKRGVNVQPMDGVGERMGRTRNCNKFEW